MPGSHVRGFPFIIFYPVFAICIYERLSENRLQNREKYSHQPVLLIGKFYNRYSRLPAKTVTWPKTQLQKLWHGFCLSRSMRVDRCFRSWLYLNAVATDVVASHEQDYDAFAALSPCRGIGFPAQGEEACYPKAYAVAVWRWVNRNVRL
jgi:hypothetical protein